MRNFACFLLLCSGSVALAAETWRWVDANGVTHYSDRPVAGAERVDLKTSVLRPNATPAPGNAASPAAQPAAPATIPYTRCVVTSPTNDETFQNPQNIAVAIEVDPALQAGHRIEVLLNGARVPEWPATSLSHTLIEVFRGSYTVNVRIVDAQSRPLCNGPASHFHVRQPTVNSPARRPTGR
jgi:hypothetical protein